MGVKMPIRTKTLAVLASIAVLIPASVYAQFTPEEIAARADIERFLQSAAIAGFEAVGEGVTKPIRLTLELDGAVRKAVWKNVSGRPLGVPDEWRYEIAAYRMDKLLGLEMVPPTVEREFQGKDGSLQIWAETRCSLLDIQEKGLAIPPAAADSVERMKYIARAFDSLIANEDRTQQNVRYTEDWRTILIDHSRSFRTSRESSTSLLFGKNGTRKGPDGRPFLIRRLPKAFFEALEWLTFDGIRNAMGPVLTEKEIRAVLSRRDLLVREIREMAAEQGSERVLYD
jgi:hypothetical protein